MPDDETHGPKPPVVVTVDAEREAARLHDEQVRRHAQQFYPVNPPPPRHYGRTVLRWIAAPLLFVPRLIARLFRKG